MKIKHKLNIILTLIGIVIIFISSLLFLNLSIKAIEKRTQAQLESVATIKENQLRNFVKERVNNIESITNDTLFSDLFNEDWQNNEKVREILKNKQLSLKNEFSEIFLLDKSGKIIFSTNKNQEGKFVNNENYFIKGKTQIFVKDINYSPSIEESTMMISAPIKNKENEMISIIAGKININNISDIMLERSGLGNTGKTYLVNKINIIFTSPLQSEKEFLGKTIYTSAVKNCLLGKNSSGKYENYKDIPVLGVYKWIPEHEICLLAEIDQNEAFVIIDNLIKSALLISILIILLMIISNSFLAKKITDPIKHLEVAANKFGAGKLDEYIKIRSKDEIGELAQTFNKMAENIKSSNRILKNYNTDLEKKVTERTKELDKKIEELKNFNNIAIGRELKMIELKKRITELEKK